MHNVYTYIYTRICMWQIHIVNTTTHGLKAVIAGVLTFGILGLKESQFEGGIQGKYFASVTCIF